MLRRPPSRIVLGHDDEKELLETVGMGDDGVGTVDVHVNADDSADSKTADSFASLLVERRNRRRQRLGIPSSSTAASAEIVVFHD